MGACLFDTRVGRCALRWSDHGISELRLPPARVAPSGGDVPAEIRSVIGAVRSLLEGEPEDLSSVRLDLRAVSEFERQVYEAARTIPPGATTTYGALATRIGHPGGARAVGRALGRNPVPLIVPCHRVLAADGRLGGFSAPGGVALKARLLALEGATVL